MIFGELELMDFTTQSSQWYFIKCQRNGNRRRDTGNLRALKSAMFLSVARREILFLFSICFYWHRDIIHIFTII